MTARLQAQFFGHRLRFARRQAGLTLDQLGQAVGHPPSYLSQLENGHREPRVSTVAQLAAALGCTAADLVDPTPPSRRAELEVALAQMQELPSYQKLRLPHLRPSARLDDTALEHIVTLFQQLQTTASQTSAGRPAAGAGLADRPVHARCVAANATMRNLMRQQDNYFAHIENVAGAVLDRVGYPGTGALSERNLTDLAAYFGFTISRVQDLPRSARSITDIRHRIIYVPQRNTASTRDARSVICQTLGHFALDHPDPVDFEGYVRQRVETNYFAGAVLAPEKAVVGLIREAKQRKDIAVEDLNGVFYISYEMAAHRLTNLITRHLDIPVHFQRSDSDGVLWKAYENDGFPLPADLDGEGIIEGKRCCRWSSARQAFASEDSYSAYYQYTETPAGMYWCATHVEIDRNRGDAVTVGTTEANAHWFRGHRTTRRFASCCPDPDCCSRPSVEQARRWQGEAWPSAADHSHFVSGLPTDTIEFSPYPGVELTDIYSFLDRHQSSTVHVHHPRSGPIDHDQLSAGT